jgi:DNA-binding response OmpR family regulator
MARFLLVEDFPPLASAIRWAIVGAGHTVVNCPTVKATLSLRDSFDHAVLDIDLPDGNGVELAEQLCREDRIGSVVFFTGTRDRELLERAARMGLVVDKAAGCKCLMSAIAQLTQPGTYRMVAVVGGSNEAVLEPSNRSGTRRKVDETR